MSTDDTAHSSTPTPSPSSGARSRSEYQTFARYVEDLPTSKRISVYKLHSLAREGQLPVYKLPNVKASCVKVAEADALLARLTAQGKIRRGYGSFGPDAVVRDLSNVAGQTFEVDQ